MSTVLAKLLAVDRRDARGISSSLTAQLRSLIARGRLSPGARLPSSRELARDVGVSRNTVTTTYGQLGAEGYLVVRRGRHPVVAACTSAAPSPSRVIERAAASQPALSPWAAGLADAPLAGAMRPLHAGFGDVREFPHAEWARCLRDVARRSIEMDQFPANSPALKAALREHLQAQRGVRAAVDQLVILPTAQAALALIATVVLAPGDVAWLEEPGYPGIRHAVAATRARIVAAPIDRHGLLPPADPARPRLIFTTPSHQFPTGRLMPVGRRQELLGLAERCGATIVEDDYDGEYHFDGAPVPALQALDEAEGVVYVGTLSKTTTPAIRLGYAVVPRHLVAPVLAAQRHWGLIAAPYVQEALSLFIRRGHYLAHVRRTRRLYQARRDHLVSLLKTELTGVLDVEAPSGGLQLQATLVGRTDDEAVVAELARRGVDLAPLSRFHVDMPRSAGFLIGFAPWRGPEIECAVALLREALAATTGAARRAAGG